MDLWFMQLFWGFVCFFSRFPAGGARTGGLAGIGALWLLRDPQEEKKVVRRY